MSGEKKLYRLGKYGTNFGRVNPLPYSAPHGEWVFCLGIQGRSDLHPYYHSEEQLGELYEIPYGMKAGDKEDVSQDIDLTGVNIVRFAGFMKLPTEAPPNHAWELSLIVGGVKKSRMRISKKRQRTRYDMAANVSKLDGLHKVAFRLELVEV